MTERILMSLAVSIVLGLIVYGIAVVLILADRVVPIAALGVVIVVIFLGVVIVDIMSEG